MSTAEDSRRRAKRRAKKKPTGDYRVGFCKPPRAHQFKPGNNANPMGRPKDTRNRKVLVKELLLDPIPAREGNTVKTMSKLEALVRQTINDALKGDHKSRLMAFGIAREHGLLTLEQVDGIEKSGLAERLTAAIARIEKDKEDGKVRPHPHPPRSGDAGKTARKGKREMNSTMKTRRVSCSAPSAAPGPTAQEFAELQRQLAALTDKYNELKQATGRAPRVRVHVRGDDGA
jgi:Family of unknown function (DUF5681)